MNVEVDDHFLIGRARDGFLDAFEILVQRYSPLAYRVAMRMVNNRDDAYEITRQTFVSAWRTISDVRTGARFSTWLYAVVTREAVAHPTRGRRGRPAAGTSRKRSIDAAVVELPPAQRVAVVLRHFEGLSYDEVAVITATSVPIVRSQLFRARRRLAMTLGSMEVAR